MEGEHNFWKVYIIFHTKYYYQIILFKTYLKKKKNDLHIIEITELNK